MEECLAQDAVVNGEVLRYFPTTNVLPTTPEGFELDNLPESPEEDKLEDVPEHLPDDKF